MRATSSKARDHIRSMLREIMIDELAHTGQRRNFIGPIGMAVSRRMIVPMFRMFYRDLPESEYLLNVDKMIEEATAFDYSTMSPEVIASSWVPSYCRREPEASVAAC